MQVSTAVPLHWGQWVGPAPHSVQSCVLLFLSYGGEEERCMCEGVKLRKREEDRRREREREKKKKGESERKRRRRGRKEGERGGEEEGGRRGRGGEG